MEPIKGRVRKFGDNIDTDIITPYLKLHLPIGELKKCAFEAIYPEFFKTAREGDIVVAGKNFGCGSSREQAAEVLKELGIQFVVCESMARIYFRNCIALGLYPIQSKGASDLFEERDEIEIDVNYGKIRNTRTGKGTSFNPLSGPLKDIWDHGGILPILKKTLEVNKSRNGTG